MIDLKTKQAFWAEQLPFFKEKYWIPTHLEVLEFDMIGGCFDIADGINTELSEEDILEIYHRVNSGWAMWKKAVSFMREKAKAHAMPDGYVLLPIDVMKRTINHIGLAMCHPSNYSYEEKIMDEDQKAIELAIEASESGAEG